VGIPRSVKLQCHIGADGVIGLENRANGSCNALFPKLGHIPKRNKDLVLTQTDTHGDPDLSSGHGVCTSEGTKRADAYDWNFCWKAWDALRSCAYDRKDCRLALGDTRLHRSLGSWSDGVPITPLKVQDAAPLRP
jgi:hypothetical protein